MKGRASESHLCRSWLATRQRRVPVLALTLLWVGAGSAQLLAGSALLLVGQGLRRLGATANSCERIPRQLKRAAAIDDVVTVASPWSVLGLREGASRNEAKARFKQLVATEHPDKHPGDEAAAKRFSAINEAYQAILTQPELRVGKPEREMVDPVDLGGTDLDTAELRRVAELSSLLARTGLAAMLLVGILLVASGKDMMTLVELVFPDGAPSSALSEADEAQQIRLGLKSTKSIDDFYLKRSGRVPGRDDVVDNDREWLEKKERLIDAPDIVNTY